MKTYAELYITDGTTEINLLDNWNVLGWRPKIAQYKEGGYWQDSPLAHGRRPTFRRFGSVVEEIPLLLLRADPDGLAYEFRVLRKLLEKAFDYWAPGSISTTPVYLAARKLNETNTRYALIMAGALPEDIDLVNPSVETCQNLMAAGYTLYLERWPFWGKTTPGTATAIALCGWQTYDGYNSGIIAADKTTLGINFAFNGQGYAGLTHIYISDGGAFSGNLLSAATPYVPFDLLPAVPAVNDAIYFGIRSGSPKPQPYWNLIFDILPAATNCTIKWEYYDNIGATWNLFAEAIGTDGADVIDETAGFTETGVKSVVFYDELYNSLLTVNGVAGYWLRARVTAATGAATPPKAISRPPYTCLFPFVHVDSNVIGGEVPALAELKIMCQSNRARDAGKFVQDHAWIDTLYWATRTYSRGYYFTPFLNLASKGMNFGQTNTAGTYTTFVGNPKGSTGEAAFVERNAIASNVLCVTVELDTVINDYVGKFHAYIRALTTTAVAADEMDIKLRARVGYSDSNTFWESEYKPVRGISSQIAPDLVDMGRLDLPPGGLKPGEVIDKLYFQIYGDFKSATGDLYLYDLILMPVDEFYGVLQEQQDNRTGSSNGLVLDNYLLVDSITDPRKLVYGPVKLRQNDEFLFSFQANAPLQFTIRPKEAVRIFFLSEHMQVTLTGDKISPQIGLIKVQGFISPQYLGSIGKDD